MVGVETVCGSVREGMGCCVCAGWLNGWTEWVIIGRDVVKAGSDLSGTSSGCLCAMSTMFSNHHYAYRDMLITGTVR